MLHEAKDPYNLASKTDVETTKKGRCGQIKDMAR